MNKCGVKFLRYLNENIFVFVNNFQDFIEIVKWGAGIPILDKRKSRGHFLERYNRSYCMLSHYHLKVMLRENEINISQLA